VSEILVEITRGRLVESMHRGDIACVDARGEIKYHIGDPHKVTFFRSSAKPLQALALIESGAADAFGLDEAEIAVACASHAAEDMHLAAVRSMLSKAGLDESYLDCGTHYPTPERAAEWGRRGQTPAEVHCNCSGKHAGMLAVARHLGMPLEGYYREDHPLQDYIMDIVAGMAGLDPAQVITGIDGCGIVVHAMPLFNMALAWARLADPTQLPPSRREAVERVVRAMHSHPLLMAGTGRLGSALNGLPRRGVVVKGGAEGLGCAGTLGAGLGVVVKIEDGNGRASGPALVEALVQVDALEAGELDGLSEFHRPRNVNHRGEEVGQIRPVFRLVSREPVAV